uniref:Complementary sex determiner n=2 Tax=Apis mellifera TaxID=7460 RepID=Q6V486_APIME|nr:complementary sex determiner [Apis mellifera]DAA06292.1 TPA_exp: complementary sex determiner [Apis mellifera]
MKRNISNYSYHDEKFKQLRNEDNKIDLRSRTKEERLQYRREAWLVQQEREQEYEKLKRKMILEYELYIKYSHTHEKKLVLERSKTKSKSPESRDRSNTSNTSKTFILSDKLESSDDTSLFRGPKGIQINATELQKIKLEIHRDLPGKSTTTTVEVKRDIINPEDVILIRRTGEGSKPIFEREEIKNVLTKINKIKEHDTVLVVNIEKSGNESKKYATSSNSLRNRTHGFQHTSSRYSRERSCSRDRNREYRKKDRRYEKLHNEKEKLLEERTSRKRYSRSREREQKSYKNENSYRKYRETSKERSRDKTERERSKERKIISSLSNNYISNISNYNNNNNYNKKLYYNINYIEQIPVPVPVPIYCGNFPPRPMGPWISIQEQIPRFRYIGPPTPFPRFIPPNAYRFRPPQNPRFGPTHQ